jgi:hypothetical protein
LSHVLEMAVEGDWEEMARTESDCDKKTSRVIWSYSETVINLLPGVSSEDWESWRVCTGELEKCTE